MFEQELALEKKSSSILPLLLLVGLIVGIVGVSLYFVAESRRVLTAAEATPIVSASLDNQPAPTLRFQTGDLDANVSDKVREPHYRLLEKQGLIKIGKAHKGNIPVALTPEGQAFLGEIAGVKQSKNKDGNLEYVVPMGQRKLVEMGKITMLTPGKAAVEYSWKWEPTKAGDLFDAAGPAVKAFNTWDRATLIERYGAHFYHAAPTTVTVALVRTESGWQVSTER
jgi:hypothetical protein